MKKFILLVLLIPAVAWCGELQTQLLNLSSMYNAAGGGASPCPAFYADTNVVFSWDGDHSSGTNYACDHNGNGISGTNSSLTISTSYGESGSNGALIDYLDEYLSWPDTGDQYIDDAGPQTVWLRINISTNPSTNEVWIFEADDGSNDNAIGVNISTTPSIVGVYRANDVGAQVAATSPGTGSFITVGYTWDASTVPDGDHAADDSGAGWDEDPDELDTSMTGNMTYIRIGELYFENTDSDGIIYVDRFCIMDGYQASPPTNW